MILHLLSGFQSLTKLCFLRGGVCIKLYIPSQETSLYAKQKQLFLPFFFAVFLHLSMLGQRRNTFFFKKLTTAIDISGTNLPFFVFVLFVFYMNSSFRLFLRTFHSCGVLMDQSLFYVLVPAPLPYPLVVAHWLQDFYLILSTTFGLKLFK